MNIRTKNDVSNFIKDFQELMEFDEKGRKFYFVFDDHERNGIWTLMEYPDETFTLHGKGEDYLDEGETVISEEELRDFLWVRRKYVNNELKNMFF